MIIQIDIDENRLKRIDLFCEEFQERRETFLKRAIDEAIIKGNKRLEILEKEKQFIESYRKHPQSEDEFDGWEEVRDWGDDFK